MTTEKSRALLCGWVEEHSDYLFRVALKHFPDHSMAEELVQDTFAAAVKAVENFKGGSSPRTWLVGILRHKIIDRIRAKTRDNSVSLDEINEKGLSYYFDEAEHWRSETGPVHWSPKPDELVERKQFMGVLDGCLQKLPDRFKSVFLLRELEGLSRDEIAENLRLTSTNVGVILHRCRMALRDCIQVKWLAEGS